MDQTWYGTYRIGKQTRIRQGSAASMLMYTQKRLRGWQHCFPLWFWPVGQASGSVVVPTFGLVCWWDGGGLMLWLFVRLPGVYLLDFFCSSVWFYLLLGPCLCFVSLLYLDLYVLGDDALIS